jgi:hypothetical protein
VRLAGMGVAASGAAGRHGGRLGAGAASSEAGGVATPAECVSVCMVCEHEGEANSDKLQMTGFAECRRSGTWRSMALPSARLEGTR